MAIPQELVDRMMVACGRRCCLCRRFKPIHLQVHHIEEKAGGGSDDWDNLICLCFTCHTDVHSKVPFARRFTQTELKGHRDSLLALVVSGQFDPNETDAYQPSALAGHTIDAGGLSKEAVELLLGAVGGSDHFEGVIHVVEHMGGVDFAAGSSDSLNPPGNNRRAADYKRGLKQLEDRGLVEQQSDSMYELTSDGYLAADELAARAASQ
jgi:hypothetical protein